MADSKISALPPSTTPLAGTEVLPIVQSSTTKQVSVANLTAGRAISATELTLTTGNLIVASGQGIDFSATSGAGTSELLADYERGTWAPTGNNITYTAASGTYVKVGALVTLYYSVTFPVTVDVNQARLGGLPYVSSNTTLEVAGGVVNLVTLVDGNTFGRFLPTDLTLYTANNTLSGLTIIGQISYEV